MTKREMRLWVRRHFAEYIKATDMGDCPDEMLCEEGMIIFEQEQRRIADLIYRHLLKGTPDGR